MSFSSLGVPSLRDSKLLPWKGPSLLTLSLGRLVERVGLLLDNCL